jgi:hypothetical protein
MRFTDTFCQRNLVGRHRRLFIFGTQCSIEHYAQQGQEIDT